MKLQTCPNPARPSWGHLAPKRNRELRAYSDRPGGFWLKNGVSVTFVRYDVRGLVETPQPYSD
jgi:hypothetical protein